MNENSSIHYVFALHKSPLECIKSLQKLPRLDIGFLLVSYTTRNGGTSCYRWDPSKSLANLNEHDIIYCSFIRCLYKGIPLDFSINFMERMFYFDYEKIDPSLERYIECNL